MVNETQSDRAFDPDDALLSKDIPDIILTEKERMREFVEELKGLRKNRGPFCIPLEVEDKVHPIILTQGVEVGKNETISGHPPNTKIDTSPRTVFTLIDPNVGYWNTIFNGFLSHFKWDHINSGHDWVHQHTDSSAWEMSKSLQSTLTTAAISGAVIPGDVKTHPQHGLTVKVGSGVYGEFGSSYYWIKPATNELVQACLSASLKTGEDILNGNAYADQRNITVIMREQLGVNGPS